MAVSLETRCKATWQMMQLNTDLFLECAELEENGRGLLPSRARLPMNFGGDLSENYR